MSVTRKPTETLHFDLVVIGGGLTGLCVAIAAARQGANVAIVQDRPVFGGNSSSEIRVVPFGGANFNAWARETGIIEELLLADRATNHVAFFDHGMVNRHYDTVLHEAAKREPNLSVFLNTSVRGVEAVPLDAADPQGPRRVEAVHGSQLASERELIFRAPQFVDCTGDATVGFLAGAEFRYGREARAEFGESLAPVEADRVTSGSTITLSARDVGQPVPYTLPSWAQEYRTEEEIGPHRKVTGITRAEYGGWWWLEVGFPFEQVEDTDAMREELHRHVLGVWNWIKNHSPEREHARTFALDWIGMIPGKRESRRLVGDVLVNEHHARADQAWPDRISPANWIIDLHTKGGILNKEEPGEPSHADANYRHWIRVAPFSVPLRAFYSRNVENLWMAGRNVSFTHVAHGATRVQQTLAQQGQCVGTAAAYALKHGLTPRQTADPDGPHIARIRRTLLRDDVTILDCANDDPADLARAATAAASSDAPLDMGEPLPDRWHALDKPRAVVFPVTTDRIEEAACYLRNEGAEPVTVRVELHRLTRLWDMNAREPVAETHIEVPPRSEGWVAARLDATTTPGRPHRLCLFDAPGVAWAQARTFPTGVTAQFLHVSPGGPEPGNEGIATLQPHETDMPPFAHWVQEKWFAHATRLAPGQRPFGAANITNGVAWPEAMPNLWVSDPAQLLPQWVELRFPEPTAFTAVQVAFDTNLNLILGKAPAFFRTPQCVRDWRLHACVGGQWRAVYEETDNYQRRRVARIAPVTATALRLEVLATNAPEREMAPPQYGERDKIYPGFNADAKNYYRNDDRTARVFEIRVYNEETP